MKLDEKLIGLLHEKFGKENITINDSVDETVCTVDKSILFQVCLFLRDDESFYFDYLSCITGIDNGLDVNSIEVIYNLNSIPFEKRITLKVLVNRDLDSDGNCSVPSVCKIWKNADWLERETYDLLGVKFENHPDLRRILLPSDWEGFPLRKDYKLQEYYHGIKVDY
ncbi:NADH-quinone oxidoreductase subunit C [Flexithrix dorotheae]|uniref:NADH-quinone oxidoreductase subunit C n=1 Tax=Flexithrix dorotheae TaxID=70993 RepID=UPI00035C66F8|nr:NADH-quinone oxidoreductase subunit C [Flexithrix dorotheae]